MDRFKKITPFLFIISCVPVYIYYYLGHPVQVNRVWSALLRAHKSAVPADQMVLFDHVWTLFIAMVVMFSGYGLGSLGLFVFDKITSRDAEKEAGKERPSLIVMVFGLGMIGFLAAVPGFAGIFNKWSLGVILIVGVLSFSFFIKIPFAGGNAGKKKSQNPFELFMWFGLFTLSLWALLPGLISALSPAVEIDELIYHLSLPAAYLRHNYISELKFNLMSYNTLGVHMIYASVMAIGPDICAKLIHFFAALIGAYLIYKIANRFSRRGPSILAAIIYIGSPQIIYISGLAYIDLFVTTFFLGAVYYYLEWFDDRRKTSLYLCCLFMGFSLAAKLTALIFNCPLALLIIYDSLRVRDRKAIKELLIGGAVAFLPALPWLLRSLIRNGDPIYPAITILVLPESTEAHLLYSTMRGSFNIVGMGREFLDYLLLPFNLIVQGTQFSGHHFFGALHPAILPLVIAGLFSILKDAKARRLLFIFIVGLYVWSTGHQFMRYALPAIAVLISIAPIAINKVFDKKPSFVQTVMKFLVVILIIVPMIISPLYIWSRFSGSIMYANGSKDRKEYLKRRLPYYKMNSFINDNLAREAKVLCWFEPMAYYIERDVITHHPEYYDRSLYEISRTKNSKDLELWFNENSVTHVMTHHPSLHYYQRLLGKDSPEFSEIKDAIMKMDEFLKVHGKKIHWSSGLVLYEIN
jgi:dolichyl-phosphate-mannose-protein mannosyltransferase